MSKSDISWCTDSWSPVRGCTPASEGCTNCWAVRTVWRLSYNPIMNNRCVGLVEANDSGEAEDSRPRWTGQVRTYPDALAKPLRWRKSRKVFVVPQGDLFHEAVPDHFIAAVFGIMAACPQHIFQVLTKRARRMREWFAWASTIHLGHAPESGPTPVFQGWALEQMSGTRPIGSSQPWPLPNVWLGITAENQARAYERIPDLLACPAAVRWVSIEPMLGPVDLRRWTLNAGRCSGPLEYDVSPTGALDWIVVGGESGSKARPMHPDWARSIRDQCSAAGVAFFFKQWGEWSHNYIDHNAQCAFVTPDGKHGPQYCGYGRDNHGALSVWKVGRRRAGDRLDGDQIQQWPEPRP